jgi:LCP family protein required for cell wall assembly
MPPFDLKPRPRVTIRFLSFCVLLFLPALLACGVFNTAVNPVPTLMRTMTSTPTVTPTRTFTPIPTFTPTPTELPAVCGGPRSMLILLIGSDARTNTYNVGLADAIRLVRVDFVEPGVQLLTFPRDLYVEIPGIEDHEGITHGKLNQAYLYGNPGYRFFDGEDQGPGLLALTLEHNFETHVDRYLAVNLQTFSRAIDTLGGIDIRLPYIVDGRVTGSRDPNRYFPAGNQHLNGYRTMLLARMRPQGDIRRSEIQNLILIAVAEKLLTPSAIPNLPGLASDFRGSIQTDLGPEEIGQLVCLATMLDSEKIEFASFPENLFRNDRVRDPVLGSTAILRADFEVIRNYVQKFERGDLFE